MAITRIKAATNTLRDEPEIYAFLNQVAYTDKLDIMP